MQFNFRHFKILQLEKLALFNLAYFCHPPIKPKFPTRQNYPIYGTLYAYNFFRKCHLCAEKSTIFANTNRVAVTVKNTIPV